MRLLRLLFLLSVTWLFVSACSNDTTTPKEKRGTLSTKEVEKVLRLHRITPDATSLSCAAEHGSFLSLESKGQKVSLELVTVDAKNRNVHKTQLLPTSATQTPEIKGCRTFSHEVQEEVGIFTFHYREEREVGRKGETLFTRVLPVEEEKETLERSDFPTFSGSKQFRDGAFVLVENEGYLDVFKKVGDHYSTYLPHEDIHKGILTFFRSRLTEEGDLSTFRLEESGRMEVGYAGSQYVLHYAPSLGDITLQEKNN